MEFERIYHEYFRDVYIFMRGLSGDEHVAEEVTQETFMKAMKSIDSFDGRKDIRAWLFTIAKNTYYTLYRKQKLYAGEDIPENTVDKTVDFTERLADRESTFDIHRFIHDMDEPYKEVFMLRTFGELPFEKIGALFKKSPGWARVTFYRARKMILEHIKRTEAVENEKHNL